MNLNELVIEITRKCNVKCRHCLRGPAQAKNISDATLYNLLRDIDYISCVTFTGGEPSLAVDRIRHFTQIIRARKISVGCFYVITNGKVASKTLAQALLELSWSMEDMEEMGGGLVISEDQYHKEVIESTARAKQIYKELSFFRDGERKDPIWNVIAEGRAKDWGVRDARLNDLVVAQDEDGNITQNEGVVYVNVNGDVVTSCDLSYESQEECKIGNVNEKSLSDILRPLVEVGKVPQESLMEVA